MEVPGLIRSVALAAGATQDSIELFATPVDAASLALERAQPGDLLVFLALTQRGEVLDLVHAFLAGN